MILNLSNLEKWCLARSLLGIKTESLYLRQLNEPVQNLITYLETLSVTSRELILQNQLSPDLCELVFDTDANTPPPSDASRNWTILPASELKNLPPVEWLIEGIIPLGGLVVIFGRSGSGKSFVSLDFGLQLAQEHNVVYIAAEGEWGYAQRIAAWCNHHHQNEGHLYMCLGAVNMRDQRDYQDFMSQIEVLDPELVIVDTLAMSMAGGDENSAKDMTQVILACKSMQSRFNTSVMIVHHVNKGGVAERGSNALRGASDIMIRVESENDLITLASSKTKDVKPFDTMYRRLIPVGDSAVLIPSEQVISDETNLTDSEQKIIDTLLMESVEEASAIELMDLSGTSKTGTYRSLTNLMRYGLVAKFASKFSLTDKAKQRFPKSPSGNQSQNENGTSGTSGNRGNLGLSPQNGLPGMGIPTEKRPNQYDYEQ